MNMPAQVLAAKARADALFDQVNGVTGEPEAKTQPAPEDQTPEVTTQDQTPEVQSPAPSTPAAPPEPPPSGSTDWEHKYRSLQGVLAAEQGRLGGENRSLAARNQALEQEITRLKNAAPATPTAQPTPANDDDTATYGPELMQAIDRRAAKIAKTAIDEQMAALQPQLAKTQEAVTNVTQQVYATSEQRFFGELGKIVPDFKQVNEDPRWRQWLETPDEIFGVPRQQALNHHQANLDHAQVATMFQKFKAEAGITATPPAAAAPAAPKPAISPSPRTVGNASAPTLREPKVGVNRSEIAAHYRRGSTDSTYRGSAEHQAMETRIATAMAAGQILEA